MTENGPGLGEHERRNAIVLVRSIDRELGKDVPDYAAIAIRNMALMALLTGPDVKQEEAQS